MHLSFHEKRKNKSWAFKSPFINRLEFSYYSMPKNSSTYLENKSKSLIIFHKIKKRIRNEFFYLMSNKDTLFRVVCHLIVERRFLGI